MKVSYYRSGNGWHDLFLLSLDLNPLMILLNATFINNNRDTIIWGDTLNGIYSISYGYFSIWDRMEKPIWTKA